MWDVGSLKIHVTHLAVQQRKSGKGKELGSVAVAIRLVLGNRVAVNSYILGLSLNNFRRLLVHCLKLLNPGGYFMYR